MADIFISYAREDLPTAKRLAEALEAEGWSIWWDRSIVPGKTFDQVIQKAIEAARCVVVLWSKRSIKSDWVKEEANIGKERKILVPAKIDPVDLPLGFGRIQAADLIDWETDKSHPGFLSLLNAISEVAGPPPERDKSVEVTQLPESNSEQELETKDGESFQADISHLKALDEEPPITATKAPHKKRFAIGIVAVASILILSVIGWFLLSEHTIHTITASSGPNGSILPTGEVKVTHGESMTFTINPSTGYHIEDIKVDGKPVGAKLSHTFDKITSDHTISTTFKLTFDPQKKVTRFLRLKNRPEFNPGKQITLEAWFNTNALGTRQAIITKFHPDHKSREPYYQYHLELRQGGQLYFALAINGIRRCIDRAFLVKPQEWHHVAATYNEDRLRLYLDGKEPITSDRYLGTLRDYGKDVLIGGVDTGNLLFTGQLAQVRIWKVARTSDQIRANMKKTVSSTEPGLVWSSSDP